MRSHIGGKKGASSIALSACSPNHMSSPSWLLWFVSSACSPLLLSRLLCYFFYLLCRYVRHLSNVSATHHRTYCTEPVHQLWLAQLHGTGSSTLLVMTSPYLRSSLVSTGASFAAVCAHSPSTPSFKPKHKISNHLTKPFTQSVPQYAKHQFVRPLSIIGLTTSLEAPLLSFPTILIYVSFLSIDGLRALL